jgi:hypothetical protein
MKEAQQALTHIEPVPLGEAQLLLCLVSTRQTVVGSALLTLIFDQPAGLASSQWRFGLGILVKVAKRLDVTATVCMSVGTVLGHLQRNDIGINSFFKQAARSFDRVAGASSRAGHFFNELFSRSTNAPQDGVRVVFGHVKDS